MGKPWAEPKYWTRVAVLLNFLSLAHFWTIPAGSKVQTRDGSGGSSLPGIAPEGTKPPDTVLHTPPAAFALLRVPSSLPPCVQQPTGQVAKPLQDSPRLRAGIRKKSSDNAWGQKSIAWAPLGNMDIASLLEVFWNSVTRRQPVLLDFRAMNTPCLCLPA